MVCKQLSVGIGHVKRILNNGLHQLYDAIDIGVSKANTLIGDASNQLNNVADQLTKKPDLTCKSLKNDYFKK